MHVKLSKYAVNNYPHFVSFPLTFCIFNILTFLTKANIDSMFVAAGPVFDVSAHFVDALFHSGDIGLLSVDG